MMEKITGGSKAATLWVAISAVNLIATQIHAAPPPLPVQKSSATNDAMPGSKPVTQETDGRLVAAAAGFSIVPPKGWEIRNNVPGLTLVLEAPADKKPMYRSTIQVRIGQGPRYLDSLGVSDFQDEITEKLGREGGSLEEFSIRNAEIVKIDDGHDALLVYAGFKLNGVEILQAHLLLPRSEQHAVVTYTDLADNFNSNAADSPLGIAWAAMSTAKMPGEPPQRFAGPIQIAALAGVLLVVFAVLLTVRNALARQAYARAATSDADSVADTTGETSNQGQNLVSSEDLLESGSPESLKPESIQPRRAA